MFIPARIRAALERRRYIRRQALIRDAFRPGGVQPSLRQMGAALDLVQAGVCEWQHAPGVGAILRGIVPPLSPETAQRMLHDIARAGHAPALTEDDVQAFSAWLATTPTQQEPGLREEGR